MTDIERIFLDSSREYLLRDFLPKIASCVRRLTDDDIWWRPNAASNSIGNLMLHLSGNVRQWIVSGIGGEPDVRNRQQEFDERSLMPGGELLATLTATLHDADRVLATLTPEQLLEHRHIQGNDVVVLDAIYHVVEHFSMHTGQIAFITKMRTGAGLGFYEVVDGIARPATR